MWSASQRVIKLDDYQLISRDFADKSVLEMTWLLDTPQVTSSSARLILL